VDGDDKSCIFWLNGWPGTGKSAIARTIARHFHSKGRLAASFFFSKGLGDSSHASMFMTTIARQLADNKLLGIQQYICDTLKECGLISNETLQDQWSQLILEPLSKRENVGARTAFLLVVDALDECEEEGAIGTLLRLLPQVGDLMNVRIRILATSRPETPIRHGFDRMQAAAHQNFVLHLVSTEISDRDIQVFLEYHLRRIAAECYLSSNWPGHKVLLNMVKCAEGLFIWAATACRFIEAGKRFAGRRLNAIMDRSSSTLVAPEQHLDEIYITVLSASVPSTYNEEEKREAYDYLTLILGGIAVLFSVMPIKPLSKLLALSEEEVSLTLSDLHSILHIPEDNSDPLTLHHDSFRNFLLDGERRRQPQLLVRKEQAHARLATGCIRIMSSALKEDICSQGEPGVRLSDVENNYLQEVLPFEARYACLYWVSHIVDSGQHLLDKGDVHGFLREHVLHWVEAMGWMGKITEAIAAMVSLESVTKVRPPKSQAYCQLGNTDL
jgi:hypothetical protein